MRNVASGNTLIPGADITDTGDKLGRGPIKVPKAPVLTAATCRTPHGRRIFC